MTDLSGQDIGKYHVIEPLGEGGMAAVYKALDRRLERYVALKVILPSWQTTDEFLKRFDREARSLAKLTHPHIVGVIDYGDHNGMPFLVMPYIPGGTLKQYSGQQMRVHEAAVLLEPIARALDYAHTHDIIHRDVKPANILITESRDPLLSDFGVARLLEEDGTTQLTSTGMGIGTPDYMAPEQWEGKFLPQTDIYALGIVFYELLTGRRPFMADTPVAVMRKHVLEPLPHPNKFVAGLPESVERVLFKALAKDPLERHASASELAKALRRLEDETRPPEPEESPQDAVATTIYPQVEAQPDPQDRIETLAETAGSAAAEEQADQADRQEAQDSAELEMDEEFRQESEVLPSKEEEQKPEAVRAEPPEPAQDSSRTFTAPAPPREKLWEEPFSTPKPAPPFPAKDTSFWKRLPKWAWVALAAALLFVIIGLATGSGDKSPRDVFVEVPEEESAAAPVEEIAEENTLISSWTSEGTPVPQPVESISPDNSGRLSELARWGKGFVGYSESVFSPDGSLLAVPSTLGLYVYRTDDWQVAQFIELDKYYRNIAFSPDGKLLALGGTFDSSDFSILILNSADGSQVFQLQDQGVPNALTFSPDGAVLASASGTDYKGGSATPGIVSLWDTTDGSLLRTLEGPTAGVNGASSLDFSPDGETLAVGSYDDTVWIWDWAAGSLIDVLDGPTQSITDVAYTPDGEYLLSASSDDSTRIWKVWDATNAASAVYANLAETVRPQSQWDISSMVVSPDGTSFAVGYDNPGIVELYSIPDGELITRLVGVESRIMNLSFSPDGKLLAANPIQGDQILIWETTDPQPVERLAFGGYYTRDVALAPDDSFLVHDVAVSGTDSQVLIRRTIDGEILQRLSGFTGSEITLALSPDGITLAVTEGYVRGENSVWLWNTANGALLGQMEGHNDSIYALAISPDGETLVSGSYDSTIIWWKLPQGERIHTVEDAHEFGITSLAFSADGTMLASSSSDAIHLWQTDSNQLLRSMDGTPNHDAMEFSPDDQTLAATRKDTLSVWQTETGEKASSYSLNSESLYIDSLAYSADGKLLALGLSDGYVVLLNTDDGGEVSKWKAHNWPVTDLAFSSDGGLLVTVSNDGTVRQWGVAP